MILDFLATLLNNAWQIVCLTIVWSIIFFLVWSSYVAAKNGIANLKRLHQIPCSTCEFFTGNYILKCPVHPKTALTEEAIGCADYCKCSPYGSKPRY